MSNFLFLFTIGPVQSFIAQARKTRDLYAGSQILSDLVEEGIKSFKKQFPSGTVIFPNEEKLKLASLPNRFIAKVVSNSTDLKAKGESIEKDVLAAWKKMAGDALKATKASMDDSQRKAFENQIKNPFNIHLVFTQIKEGNESSYAAAYEELERLGGAIKNIRDFHQFPEFGRKCSLDGANNALFCSSRNKGTWQKWNSPVKVNGFRIEETEALSAINMTKRFYPMDEKFPSTARVALMQEIDKLASENKDRLKCFEDLFKPEKIAETCIKMFNKGLVKQANITDIEDQNNWNTDWDEHYLIEENLDKIINPEQRKLLGILHKELKKHLKTRYYAIIHFDGDQMGKWLSGENNKTQSDLEEFHTTLSGALAQFGKEARAYLDKSNGNGHTVYAGGDDFLGFVNIHHLFEAMKFLRKRFDEIVNTAIVSFKQPDKNITFSAGIVIAHYKAPFSEVLKKVRDVEKAAKNEGDRNAFGIAVMKHSGEIQQAIYKWDKDEANPSGCSNLEALEQIYLALDKDDGNFSNTFIQNLTTEITCLTGVNMDNLSSAGDGKVINKLIPEEIKRLVDRSWKESKKKDKDKIKKLSKEVVQLWQTAPKESDHRPRNFIHALHVADFLTRKITQEQ